MAAKRVWVEKLVEELITRLSEKVDVERVILFGSYAWGRPNKYSDLDIAVVSASFNDMDDIKRIMILSDCARYLRTPKPVGIDLIGFTPQEFRTAGYFDLAGEIKERGEVLYSKAA